MQGFYGVYEALFQQLARQEAEAARQAGGKGAQTAADTPLFGAAPLLSVGDRNSRAQITRVHLVLRGLKCIGNGLCRQVA